MKYRYVHHLLYANVVSSITFWKLTNLYFTSKKILLYQEFSLGWTEIKIIFFMQQWRNKNSMSTWRASIGEFKETKLLPTFYKSKFSKHIRSSSLEMLRNANRFSVMISCLNVWIKKWNQITNIQISGLINRLNHRDCDTISAY